MRVAISAALLSAAFLTPPQARAAEIVQFINTSLYAPVQGFDSRLGVLEAVKAEVDLTTYRQWFISTPSGSPPNRLDWSVDSSANIIAFNLASADNFPLIVPIKGSGSIIRNEGVFDVVATGRKTFDLAPAAFNGVSSFALAHIDPGLSDTRLSGTAITSLIPATLLQTEGACLGGLQGSDLCGFGSVRLTFTFSPFASAVPEPATWAMMLIGFAAIGMSLRRHATPRLVPTV